MLNKKLYLACVCQKTHRKMLSPIFQIEALNEYYLVDQIVSLSGIQVDGSTNYIDWVELW